ncbi:hypothetical protein Bhyg_00526, partial [Pseudolycoriella hygida]
MIVMLVSHDFFFVSNGQDAPKSQCSSLSDGESFEGFGENYNQEGGIDLELAPHLNSTRVHETLPNRRWGSMR